jgi:spore coat polysaccharide biosynthesis protein SpsF
MSVYKNPNIIAIVQARMKSNRLPGKVMKDIGGQPMLGRVVERVRMSKLINQVIVATTTDPTDDEVAAFCQTVTPVTPCFRGSLHDVLDRFYQAALFYRADVVVRFTADCPLLDAGLIDQTLSEFLRTGVDFAANRLPPPFKRTYPIGVDTEVCSFQALSRAWKEATETYEREHVMPYLYDVPDRFNILRLEYHQDLSHMRWTVDTAEDLEVVRRVYSFFGDQLDFTWLEVLDLFVKNPELSDLNAGVKHKTYLDFDTAHPNTGKSQ